MHFQTTVIKVFLQVFLGESVREPVALLSGLVEGTFLFDLTVWDHSEEMNTTTVSLIISNGTYLPSVCTTVGDVIKKL